MGTLGDAAVFDIHDAVKDIERAVVVSHDEDASVALVGHFGKEFHHLASALAVERGARVHARGSGRAGDPDGGGGAAQAGGVEG